jgi:cyclopropane fatty-acyl-phospholipid synthase-like methyltransferase
MNDSVSGIAPEDRTGNKVRYYKKDFWSKENLKFSQPWYRLEKSSQIIGKLAQGQERTLLDIGCGPATLMRLLPPNIRYYGIDIAIHDPAPNLIEADILEAPIKFGNMHFDIIIAQGVFEYLGIFQSQKFAEVAQLLNKNGTFIVSYTNFAHRKKQIYAPFSNLQSFDEFREGLSRHFVIDRIFPASHNWTHAQPNRKFVKAVNMHLNINVPFISPILAVEYFYICSPKS